MPTVGVLAIQGSFKEHLAAVARLGAEGKEVRLPSDLADCAALIIPGGESTAIGLGLQDAGLLDPVRAFCKTKPVWGVCAGLILLADHLEGADTQTLVGGLKITAKRNAFGRQIDSKFRSLSLSKGAPASLCTTSYFIRAPLISKTGSGVTPLATVAEGVVAARDTNKLVTCFHPEISRDDTWLKYFLTDIAKIAITAPAAAMPTAAAVGPWLDAPALEAKPGTAVKRAFAIFQQGGVIMDVVNAEQARIAEAAGAVSVMALERIPADIKADGGVARSSDPRMIKEVLDAISIPCMAKARIGHFYEGKVLEVRAAPSSSRRRPQQQQAAAQQQAAPAAEGFEQAHLVAADIMFAHHARPSARNSYTPHTITKGPRMLRAALFLPTAHHSFAHPLAPPPRRPSRWTALTSPRYSPPPTRPTTSTSAASPSPLCAALRTWARRSAASPRARR